MLVLRVSLQKYSILQVFSALFSGLILIVALLLMAIDLPIESKETLVYLLTGSISVCAAYLLAQKVSFDLPNWWFASAVLGLLIFFFPTRFEMWVPLAAICAAIIFLQREMIVGILPLTIGIMACGSLRWWLPSGDLSSWFAVLLAALLFAVLRSTENLPAKWRIPQWLYWTVGAVLFAISAARPEIDFYSQSFYLGTIDMLRAGGHALWDTPSQYGFLHIVLTAWLPFSDSIVSLYVANAFCLWVSGLLFYSVCKKIYPSEIGNLFSLGLAFIAVMLIPGWSMSLTGPNPFPSVGAYRFLLVYIMLAILVMDDLKRKQQWWLLSITWAISFLWAFEVAYFCSAILFPVLLTRWQKKFDFLLLAPLLSFLTVISCLCLSYLIFLDHWPDLFTFVEYASSYASGFGSLAIQLNGAVSVLLWVWAILLVTLCWQVQQSGRLDYVAAALGCMFAVSVYFIGRSHDNNVLNIVPILLLVIALCLLSIRGVARHNIELLSLPFIAVILSLILGNLEGLQSYFVSFKRVIKNTHIVRQYLPKVSNGLMPFLYKGGYQDGEPLTFIGPGFLAHPASNGMTQQFTPWTPATPVSMFSILPEDRQRLMVERTIQRTTVKVGWILEEKVFADVPKARTWVQRQGQDYLVLNPTRVLYPVLQQRYRMTLTQENPTVRLYRFELF